LKLVPYELSISIGVAHRESHCPQSMEDLLALADLAMYENKRSKRDAAKAAEDETEEQIEAVA
jgi:GGDEF domain-containing protein